MLNLEFDYSVEIIRDPNPTNPRDSEAEVLSIMLLKHWMFDLPWEDETIEVKPMEDLTSRILEKHPSAVIENVYCSLEEGAVQLSVWPFEGSGAGAMGRVYATRERALKYFKRLSFTKQLRERTRRILSLEVDIFGRYLNGDTYCYRIQDVERRIIDECCGFYDAETAFYHAVSLMAEDDSQDDDIGGLL